MTQHFDQQTDMFLFLVPEFVSKTAMSKVGMCWKDSELGEEGELGEFPTGRLADTHTTSLVLCSIKIYLLPIAAPAATSEAVEKECCHLTLTTLKRLGLLF